MIQKLLLAAIALLLGLPSDLLHAQAAASFSSTKKRFEEEFQSADAEVRQAALAALAEHGTTETVRYILDVARNLDLRILEGHAALSSALVQQAELQREVNLLKNQVAQGKLGERTLNRKEASLAEAKERTTSLRASIDLDTKRLVATRQAVGWAIQRCDDRHRSESVRLIAKAYGAEKEIEDKVALLRIMVWVDDEELLRLVEEQARHKEAPTRVAALRAMEERGGIRARTLAIAGLNDPEWQVRAQSIRLLRQVGGNAAAEALCSALQKEDGRLITDAMGALRAITGQDFFDNVHLWREWLAKNGDTLPEPSETKNAAPMITKASRRGAKAAAKGHGTGFYGIDSASKHVVYVIDFSGSMAAPLAGGNAAGGNGPAKIGGDRKVDGVATELIRAIESLPSEATFNVVLFRANVVTWNQAMQNATPANKAALKEWVLTMGPSGSTNLFEAMEQAFTLAGRGSFDRHYRAAVDTIFLLTDGSPTAGRIQNTNDIVKEIGIINDLRRIAIHCVGLGRSINAGFLRTLATQNDGSFVHVTR
jgi:HEAT repeat protein